MIDVTSNPGEFNSLSLDDLIRTQDLYHVHLMHKQNVVATAIGRYLIRDSDPWPNRQEAGRRNERTRTIPRRQVASPGLCSIPRCGVLVALRPGLREPLG